MTVEWNDLTHEDQRALERLRGRYLTLTTDMDHRLRTLGLAERNLGGTMLSRLGLQLLLSRGRRLRYAKTVAPRIAKAPLWRTM